MALGKNITPAQGSDYYEKDDYYLKVDGGPELRLQWKGSLAQELGLSGKVDRETWEKALHGHFPKGIEIAGGTFADENGEKQKRSGTDFVIEAPKTLSMLFAGTTDPELRAKILGIQEDVMDMAVGLLEEQAAGRRRVGGGKRVYEQTGKILAGAVTHLTNRDGGAFIHGHIVELNLTKTSDGQYRSLNNERQFAYQRMVKEACEAKYAELIQSRLGIGIEKGKYGEVQLAGFSREQIEAGSTRGNAVERFLKEKFGIDRAQATPEQKETAWEMTRKAKKVKEIERLETDWKTSLEASGTLDRIREIEGAWHSAKSLSPEKRFEVARESLAFAIEHHTEREAAVKEGELIRTALQDGRGKIGIEDLKKAMTEAEKSGELIRQADGRAGSKANLITSREAREREKRLLRMEKDGRGAVEPLLNPFQAEASLKAIQEREGIRLNAEQEAAARLILTTDNRFIGINGYAGVGKTAMLKPGVEIMQDAGYRVIGLAPQHSGVKALKEAGITEAMTLQSWLSDRKVGEALTKKTVVLIDEAGLANAKDLEAAMRRIEKAGARKIFTGDDRQYESVEAGPAFRSLQKNGMETARVTEMQRQRNAPGNVREAAKASVDDPAKALSLLEKNITEIRDPGERFKALAKSYLESKSPADTLVLTGTHEARRAVNAHVREATGKSGTGTDFTVFRAEDRTAAERKKVSCYENGQEIRFGKDYRSLGIEAGEVGKVAGVDRENGKIRLEMPDGRIRDFEPHRLSGKGWEIGQTESLELSNGDRIRITGNGLKEQGITNGMRGEVLEASEDRIRLAFDNGREASIPVEKKPLEIDHGYAQTGHSAQGLGAKTVILDLPSGSQTLNRRSFYTNLTRTKEDVIAFTDDRERLTRAVTWEKDKTMALDMEEQSRGMEMDRDRERERSERRGAEPREKTPDRERAPETRERVEKTPTGAGRTWEESQTPHSGAQKMEKTAQTPMEEKKRKEREKDRGRGR